MNMAYKINTLNKGLILHLPLDQTHKQGTNYSDLSASGYAGTPVNAPTATTDRFGRENRALAFDGLTQYVDLSAHIAGFSSLAAGTICGWFKVAASGGRMLLNFSDDTASQRLSIFQSSALGTFRFSASGTIATIENAYSLNEWVFFCLTQAGAGIGYTFRVGDKTTSGAISHWFASVVGPTVFNLCQYSLSGVGSIFWNGSLADLRIYNRALSQAEVQAIYRLGGTGTGNLFLRG
jgi:hypothetical protein